jgi:hypothetical protein
MLPHFHISGIHALVTFLYIVAIFGALHLLAASMPDNKAAEAWLSLGF